MTSSPSDQPQTIKAITLWQPFAELIFTKRQGDPGAMVKGFETRSFRYPPKYAGQRVAIHAAVKPITAKVVSDELHELCMDVFGCAYNHTLARGAVLGTVRLGDVVETAAHRTRVDEDEIAAGDWSDGRYAWKLYDVRRFPMPVPMKGQQGWWNFTLPAGL